MDPASMKQARASCIPNTHMHTLHMCARAHTDTCTHTHAHTRTHSHIHTHTHTYTNTHTLTHTNTKIGRAHG